MGGVQSINHSRLIEPFHVLHTESSKRQKTSQSSSSSSFRDDKAPLLPGLPDEISHQIVARIPRIWYLNLKAVSRSWKAAVTSPEIYKIRKELGTTEEWLYFLMCMTCVGLVWHALDPVTKLWQRLPRIPDPRIRGTKFLEHLKRKVSHGCGIAAVDGCLYMLGGVARYSSLTNVWKYDPVSNCWSEASPMSVGRANFQTTVLNNKLFVVGGQSFSPHHAVGNYTVTLLQSAEVFDPEIGLWSDIPSMPCLKAHAIAAEFLPDGNTPVAIGLASYRGKLYVPQNTYPQRLPAASVCGEVYDPETNSWVDMPRGMSKGWLADLWETNPTAIVGGDLYALKHVYPLGGASERLIVYVYNHQDDSWKVVEGDLPFRRHSQYIPSGTRTRSNWPYILIGLLGKLHAVTVDDNDHTIVVMRADKLDDSITSSSDGTCESVVTSESNIWSVIATGNIRFGRLARFGQLVGCQNLDV